MEATSKSKETVGVAMMTLGVEPSPAAPASLAAVDAAWCAVLMASSVLDRRRLAYCRFGGAARFVLLRLPALNLNPERALALSLTTCFTSFCLYLNAPARNSSRTR